MIIKIPLYEKKYTLSFIDDNGVAGNGERPVYSDIWKWHVSLYVDRISYELRRSLFVQ